MSSHDESEKAKALLQKYLDGTCTPQEEEIVHRWFYSFNDKGDMVSPEEEDIALKALNTRLDSTLFEQPKENTHRIYYSLRLTLIAAVGLCILGVSLWFFVQRDTASLDQFSLANQIPASNSKYKNDILPGSHFAKLKYANGEELILNDSAFFSAQNKSHKEEVSVVLDVPKAGTYKVVLEDGTRVWLNSSSRLTYPEHFSNEQRLVTLEGEGYFEVAKDAKRPFRIAVNNTQIEVLGTTFNVHAYQHEVRTSLVEGSVKIRNDHGENILQPGEEAVVLPASIRIEKANLDKNTAWQKGEFYFDGSNFSEVIEQIARWYNVDFENAEQLLVGESSYNGSIDRNTNLSNVLEILSVATKKTFSIEGRKIIIK